MSQPGTPSSVVMASRASMAQEEVKLKAGLLMDIIGAYFAWRNGCVCVCYICIYIYICIVYVDF